MIVRTWSGTRIALRWHDVGSWWRVVLGYARMLVSADRRALGRRLRAEIAYCEIMDELLAARDAAGGKLTDDEECRYIDRLDQLWWRIGEDGHRRIEHDYALGAN